MTIKNRLDDLKIELPPFNNAAANYLPAIRSGNLVFTAGQTPKIKGILQYTGQVRDNNIEDGQNAAKLCALNCLSILDECAGGLDNISRIIKVTGFVNAEYGFEKHAKVLDGATNMLVDVFGEIGRPARSAIGVASLPGNAMCEIEMVVELKVSILSKL